jgi:site-specific DNA recombinase
MKSTPSCLRAALYARVSSDHQADQGTIASQVDALRHRAALDGLRLDDELCFLDDGYSGSTLLRPGLERLRDQAAAGAIDRLYVLAPDRLARHFAYQFLLVQEFQAAGVELLFLNRELGRSPEDDLLLQVQGIIAEYERATIVERCRRGKQHAARQGQVSVLASAPYGYRYVSKAEGGGVARYDIVLEEARGVRQIFLWVARERLSLREVCRRLQQQGVPTRTGNRRWHERTIGYILKNPAYRGQAGYGKSRVVPRRPQLRPRRGKPPVPRRAYSVTSEGVQVLPIAVPPLVSEELFAEVAEQLAENRRRVRARRGQARHLLQGLLVCRQCGYALSGIRRRHTTAAGQEQSYGYYRCGGQQRRSDDGTKVCRESAVSSDQLEEAVWEDVCGLLREPARVQQEYERRLEGEPTEGERGEAESFARRAANVKRTISRLIDSYSEGLLEKEEFEPRLRAARERLARLEGEAKSQADEAGRRAELRLVLGKFQEFAEQIQSGLHEADWATRREILRALVKQIEVGDEDIHIVYRIPPVPFVENGKEEVLQDCAKGCVP